MTTSKIARRLNIMSIVWLVGGIAAVIVAESVGAENPFGLWPFIAFSVANSIAANIVTAIGAAREEHA